MTNYTLRNIPDDLWIALKHAAVTEQLTLRALILAWLAARVEAEQVSPRK